MLPSSCVPPPSRQRRPALSLVSHRLVSLSTAAGHPPPPPSRAVQSDINLTGGRDRTGQDAYLIFWRAPRTRRARARGGALSRHRDGLGLGVVSICVSVVRVRGWGWGGVGRDACERRFACEGSQGWVFSCGCARHRHSLTHSLQPPAMAMCFLLSIYSLQTYAYIHPITPTHNKTHIHNTIIKPKPKSKSKSKNSPPRNPFHTLIPRPVDKDLDPLALLKLLERLLGLLKLESPRHQLLYTH